MPPSAKLVYKVLEYNGRMTQREIAEKSLLSSRTVRYALKRLKEEDLIREYYNLQDMRTRFYENL